MKLLGAPLFPEVPCSWRTRASPSARRSRSKRSSKMSQSVATAPPFAESATAALRLFRRSALCRLLVPTNLAFGLAAAYLNGSFLSAVVAEFLGERAVGAVSAVVVASAADASAAARPPRPLNWNAATRGRARRGLLRALRRRYSDIQQGGARVLGWRAVALAVVFGAGRATWEENFKSSVADDFHDATTAAFANVTVQSGLASTLGFLLNAHAPPRLVAIIVVACSAAAIASQAVAAKIRSKPPNDLRRDRCCVTKRLDVRPRRPSSIQQRLLAARRREIRRPRIFEDHG